MTQSIIGIDVSKRTLDIAFLQENQAKYLKIDNDLKGFKTLEKWLGKNGSPTIHACMEATGQYGFASARYLYECGHRVSIINPARIKAYASSRLQRNKTDKVDARLIAEFCQRENPVLWNPPRPAYNDLKALVHYLDDLMGQKCQEKNRMEFGKEVDLVASMLTDHIAFLDDQIKSILKAIHNLIQQDPQFKHDCQLLMSIPGVGELTAARLLSEIRDFRAFESSRQLTAYAGLNPRQYQSGSSIHRKSRISKIGNAKLRYALYMPALVAYVHNPVIKAFCQRLLENGKPKMVVIGAAMRKLLVLAYGVIKTDLPFDPDFSNSEVLFA